MKINNIQGLIKLHIRKFWQWPFKATLYATHNGDGDSRHYSWRNFFIRLFLNHYQYFLHLSLIFPINSFI
jgi:hypothetical protein